MSGALAAVLDAAARWPGRVAIEGEEAVTYEEVIDRGRRLAARLRDEGVGRGDAIGLDVDRSAAWVVGMIGAWMAGAAFVPLRPQPARRREEIARVAKVVLDEAGIAARTVRGLSLSGMCARRPPDDLAYVMFTSGTTGAPREVRIAHRGLGPLVAAQVAAFALDHESRALWLHAPVFDASISDVCTTLAAGATLVIAPTPRAPSELRVLLEGRAITHVDLPTALLPALEPTPRLRTVVLGGEACDVERVRRLAERVRVVVVYGPTEATVCTSLAVVDPATWDAPRIGAPIAGVEYRVVDGELWIGGPCLALGLGPWYRTGDRVTDDLVFVGRADRQVKLGGRRVELDEVEAALRASGTTDAAAVVRDGVLVAHVTGEVDRAALAERVPAWMIPRVIERRDALPRTATGKLDRGALDPIAAELAPLWRLAVGALDDAPFPGDSLAALTLVAAAEARGLAVTPAMLSDAPTFGDLVARVREAPEPPPLRVRDLPGWDRQESARAGTSPARGTVLITGATGALGSRVVEEWRRRDGRRVIRLARGDRGELRGDLARPRLGLDDATWARLADEVEVIVHAGAAVNLAASWDELAPTNVGGTAELARLCATGRPKRWHHVSSLGVFVGTDRGAGRHEETEVPHPDAVIHGAYAATKIAAEAIARPHATTILRLGLLVAPSTTSQLAMTLRGLRRLGAVPRADLRLDVTPIDHAARAVVALALAGRGVHHVASPEGASLDELAHAMRRAGVALDELAPDEWADHARAQLADPEVAMAYLALCRAHAPDRARLRGFDLFLATGADFAVERTAALLAELGVPPPPRDLDRLITEALA